MLDMDGVVNSDELVEKWFNEKKEELNKNGVGFHKSLKKMVWEAFDAEFCDSTELVFPELAERIMKICNETDAYIVWSSTWRKLEKYADIEAAKDMFNRRGLPGNKLIGYTPQIGTSWYGKNRSGEIKAWMDEHKDVYEILKCAVIDDRIDAGYDLYDNMKYFNTNEYIGITDHNVKEIIEYLNGE